MVPKSSVGLVERSLLVTLAAALQFSVMVPLGSAGLRITAADLLVPPLLALALVHWLREPADRPQWRVRRLPLWLLALTGWLVVGLLVGRMAMGAWLPWAIVNKFAGWFVLLSYFAVGIRFAQISTPALRRTFVSVLTGVAVLVALYSMGLYALSQMRVIDLYPRLVGFLDNPNAFGMFLAVVAVVALASTSAGPVVSRRLDPILTAVLFAAVILSGSRSAMLGMAMGVFVLVALGTLSMRRLITVAALSVGIVALLLALPYIAKRLGAGEMSITHLLGPEEGTDVPHPYFLRNDVLRDGGVRHRMRILADAITLWKDTPLVGIGVGTFYFMDIARYGASGATIHNTALWVLTELGVIGLALFVGFFAVCATTLWRDHRRGRLDPLALGGLAALAVIVAASVGMETLYQRYLWLLGGYALVLVERPGATEGLEHSAL